MSTSNVFLLILALFLLGGCGLFESDGSVTEVTVRYQWPTVEVNRYQQVVYPDSGSVGP